MRNAFCATVVLLSATAACVPASAAESSAERAVSLATLPASLPVRRDGVASGEGHGWKGPLSLLVLAGVGGAWVGWRRLGRRKPQAPEAASAARIIRMCSQALTPQVSLHAVQWNGEELLVACTSQQVNIIARRTSSVGEEAQP